ncbi:MAG: hypothetical protein IPN62_16875 [Flavobacteriales bacterium]|nr:hypothetical protein [Flavobacteriales bacterium]
MGTFLSGGVDSSIATALPPSTTTHCTPSASAMPRTATTTSAYAEEGWRPTCYHAPQLRLTHEELAEAYPRLLAAIDEPFTDSSALPSFVLCERTRKHVTVALSGDGATRCSAGFGKHQAELVGLTRDPPSVR